MFAANLLTDVIRSVAVICLALKNVCICFNVKNRVYAHTHKLNGFLNKSAYFIAQFTLTSQAKRKISGMEIETGEGQLQIHLVTKQLQ